MLRKFWALGLFDVLLCRYKQNYPKSQAFWICRCIDHLTVAFFLPGQHKWHHEYGLIFFASNFVRKGCMEIVFKWTISFRILFPLKKIFNILPSVKKLSCIREYSKFRIFGLRRVPTIWILYSIFVLYSQIQPQINSHLAGNVYI